jgi:hypothetical protein
MSEVGGQRDRGDCGRERRWWVETAQERKVGSVNGDGVLLVLFV